MKLLYCLWGIIATCLVADASLSNYKNVFHQAAYAVALQQSSVLDELAIFSSAYTPRSAIQEVFGDQIYSMESVESFGPFTPCEQDMLNILLKAIAGKEGWAIQFLDAIFKPPAGILDGNLFWLGAYDECLSLNININDPFFKFATVGTYANVGLSFGQNVSANASVGAAVLHVGLCLPSSCNATDIVSLVGTINSFAHNNKIANLSIDILTAEKNIAVWNPDLPLSDYFVIAMCIVAVIAVLNVIGTLYDIMQRVTSPKNSPALLLQTTSLLDLAANSNIFANGVVVGTAGGHGAMHSNHGIGGGDDDADHLIGDTKPPPGFISAGIGASASSLLPTVSGGPSGGNSILGDGNSGAQNAPPKRQICHKFFMAFSFLRNAERLLAASEIANPEVAAMSSRSTTNQGLAALHGIRVLSMFWVILGHTYVLSLGGGVDNFITFLNYTQNFEFQVVSEAYLAVDTFLVIGGFLIGYLTIRQLDKLNQVPMRFGNWVVFWIKFYAHRVIRIIPVYAFAIILYMGLSPVFANGPVWSQETDPLCVKNWWTNLLFVNNIVDREKECMGWTWYLALDMQFFLISPIPLLLFFWKPVFGWISIVLLMIVHAGAGAMASHRDGLEAAPLADFWSLNATGKAEDVAKLAKNFFGDLYVLPWCRVGPWAMGLGLGCAIHRMPPWFSNARLQAARSRGAVAIIGWTLSTLIALLLVYGLWPCYVYPDYQLPQWVNELYWGTSRLAWGGVVCWVIYACIAGSPVVGIIVRKCLAWRPLVFLSRLTYCAYIYHPVFMSTYFLTIRTPIHLNWHWIEWAYCGSIVIVYGWAFILSAAIEMPFANLEGLVMPRR